MKNKIICLFLITIFAATIYAVPFSILGEMKVPSAYVLPNKMVQVGVTSFIAAPQDEDYEMEYGYNVNFGIMDRVELGLVGTGKDIYYGNFKLQLIDEKRNIPAISFGVDNVLSKIDEDSMSKYSDVIDVDDYESNSIYMVFSKTSLIRGLPFVNYLETTMHFGMGKKRFVGGKIMDQFGGLFGALIMRPNKYVSVIAEMDGENGNLGLSLTLSKIALRGGLYRIEEMDIRKAKFAFNLVYSFDKLSEKKFEETRPSFSVGRRVIVNDPEAVSNDSQPSNNPILEELKEIRKRRKESEKELEEIKKMLEEE